MMFIIALPILVTACVPCDKERGAAAGQSMMMVDGRKGSAPRARDGDAAILEELEAARKAGSIAAFDLFLARHSNHPLSHTAERERQRLINQGSDRSKK